MKSECVLNYKFYYSYGTLNLMDVSNEDMPEWTNQHQEQGFARLNACVVFSTIRTDGIARIRVFKDIPCSLDKYTRVIRTSLQSNSGEIKCWGVEDDGFRCDVGVGFHDVYFAVRYDGGERFCFDLYIDKPCESAHPSEILVRDDLLTRQGPLLETADII